MFDTAVNEVLLERNIIERLSLRFLGEPVDADTVVLSVGVGSRLLWIFCGWFGLEVRAWLDHIR